jgi:hypothetical protein
VDEADIPAFKVVTRRDGAIRHFWSGEMGPETADPGQDPRGGPDLMPIWTILDNSRPVPAQDVNRKSSLDLIALSAGIVRHQIWTEALLHLCQ